MRTRPITTVMVVAAWGVFALAIVWPTIALLGTTIVDHTAPADGFTFSSRQLGLLWRTIWMSCAATAACLLVSIPGAYVVGQVRGLSRRPLITGLLAASLLCPPMVYALGWERILPTSVSPHIRCVGTWALWAWPIPAFLIGTAWARAGRRAYEAALLVASPASAFLRVALPLLIHYIALSGLILFLLFSGDYGVPHSCGVVVFATELLGWAASSTRPIDTVWPAMLAIVVDGLALIAMFVVWRRCTTGEDDHEAAVTPHGSSRSLVLTAVACFTVSLLLPVATLVVKLGSWGAFAEAFSTYNRDLVWTLGVATASGVVAVAMGLGVAALPSGPEYPIGRRMRMFALIWALIFGAMPGALIGKALVVAYNHDALWFLYDHWTIVALSYVSRFGWIGVGTGILASQMTDSDLIAQAETDGAAHLSILTRIQLPMRWPTLVCGAGIVAVLSIADVATSALVRIPGPAPIAHILIEKFHRFEDGMLISLSLWLVLAALFVVALFVFALGRGAARTER